MKNIKYMIFLILFLFVNVFYVNASCTKEEISSLKEEVSKIKITYKHKGIIEDDEIPLYSQFDVTIRNIREDMYISLMMGTVELENVDGTSFVELSNGKYIFKVNSKKCDIVVDEIDVFLPTFNLYSLDPLCEGISGDDFPLCGKYYEYNVSYNEFLEGVNEYRNMNNIDNVIDDIQKNMVDTFVEKFMQFIIKYQYSILFVLLFCLFILIFIMFAKKRKKRGVLE